MTRDRPEPSEVIRRARRSLEGHARARLTGELLWDEKDGTWAFPVELNIETKNSERVPRSTAWYFVLDPRYPWGNVEIYPAKNGGIGTTFPHQDHNGSGDEKLPWRSGDICVLAPAFALGRSGSDPDPKGDPNRILWFTDRALVWLERASAGTLTRNGDDFELPQWKSGPLTVGFSEDATTFQSWRGTSAVVGTVELVSLGDAGPFAARRFLDEHGRSLIEPSWGRVIRETSKPRVGAWIRLPSVPLVGPYGAPMNWGELTATMEALGVSPSEVLPLALKPLRDGFKHVLLVGFPVPRKFGDPPSLFHWQPMLLPELSYGTKPVKGFSANDKGYWLGDKVSVLSSKRGVNWLTGRNWAQAEIATRGQLSLTLREKNVLLIGGGALGAAVAEILVRGGVLQVVVVDGDSVAAGNLVRHTLTLADVGQGKAERLATRLNSLTPHADVERITATFPKLSEAELTRCRQCDLVIDCSGTDDVLQALAESERGDDTLFVSIAMGRGAKRLYLYRATGQVFPIDDFRQEIAPWLARDAEEFGHLEFPWEGVGCWHPVFPATPDQVWAFAASAVRDLGSAVSEHRTLGLAVFELPDNAVQPERAGEHG